ncbi:MAG: hypothetical protein ABUK01_08955 [Leptospirales bacterium]
MRKIISRLYPVFIIAGLFLYVGVTGVFTQTVVDTTDEAVETVPEVTEPDKVSPNAEELLETEPGSDGEDSSTLDQPEENSTESIKTDETEKVENTEVKGETELPPVKPEKNRKKRKKKKVARKPKQKSPLEQFRWTPEDPSFLYETRFLPGQVVEQEFLSVEQEKEVAEERIEEEKNFRESLEKLDFQLPEPGKLAFVVITVIIIVVYRIQVNKAKKKRGKF